MTMAKRHSYQCRHPIDAYPFEAFYHGSWRSIERVTVNDGGITMHFDHHGFEVEEKIPIVNLRIRSRKASISDCPCFLWPGVDICVLSTNPSEASSGEERLQPAWLDAKINSIERKPHESRCTCRFYVNFYKIHHPHGMGKSTLKEISEVAIENIAIIQKLDGKPCEDRYYRWSSSKDCRSTIEAKLSRGQFSFDVSWLLVASTLKGVGFDIRSMQNKMVYRILDGEDTCSLGSDKIVNTINFRREDGVLRPNSTNFVPEVPVETFAPANIIEVEPLHDLQEDGLCNSSLYDLMGLRRSKRRNVQPERFVSYGPSKAKSCTVRTETDRIKRWNEVKTQSLISCQADIDCLIHTLCLGKEIGNEKIVRPSPIDSARNFLATQSKITSREVKAGVANRRSHRNQVAEDHKKAKTTTACKRPAQDKGLWRQVQHSSFSSKQNKKRVKSSASNRAALTPNTCSVIPLPPKNDPMSCQQDRPRDNVLSTHQGRIGRQSSKSVVRSGPAAIQRKNMSGRKHRDFEDRLKEKGSYKELKSRSSYFCLKRKRSYDARTYRQNFFSSIEYKEVIERCMKSIEPEIKEPQPPSVSQWEAIRAVIPSDQRRVLTWTPPVNDQVESPELENLWKEMEASRNAVHFLEENQSNVVEFCNEVVDKSSEGDGQSCQHEYKMDEEIGIICQLCSFVSTEIRYVSPPFLQSMGRFRNKEPYDENKLGSRHTNYLDLDLFCSPSSSRVLSLKENNVWSLIPDFRNKLHIHQQKAFEFLWRNIAGSLMPADIEVAPGRTGGCVISHSPGAGKTLLVISFLVSYLRLFPGKRPLILAPKTTLYTWCKEIEKWEVSIPVYQIHTRGSYRNVFKSQTVGESLGEKKLNKDVMHIIDCLEKLRKWHEHPSILLMGYTSFFSLMREKSKLEHWRYMARVLEKSTGILILDEGHNPRSTRSMLRKTLMKVKTEQRILLSGTLFQNNFEEYFNTLCLARPSFITEVLRELAPTVKINRNWKKSTISSKENLARRFFVEKIAGSIYSKVDQERKQGLTFLKKMTSGFIDVYECGTSGLPGLESYTLLMKPTEMQQEVLSKLQKYVSDKRFPLELELLITVGSIHPWLITTYAYVGRFFNPDELEELEKHKLDVTKGSKVRFVVNLMHRCIIKGEKVLIFCHNIAPINLFVEIFERIFGWNKGDEVLVLQGEQELFERARVIEKFEEPGGVSQVLLASSQACSEGISLTAASRVVLLDSEWNPSKTKQAVARAYRPGQERVVYVYQLLASGTLEEEKYDKTTLKEWVSRMIFVGAGVEDSSCRQAENIEDEVLREMVEEDQASLFYMIMKDEKLSHGSVRGKEEAALFSPK